MMINKSDYYPIKIIYKNEMTSLIFLEDKEQQIEFGNYLKMKINNINFEDVHEIKEEIGNRHFGFVKKCINKKKYAVKIIDKQKLDKEDFEFIMHEKNYMKLIKHQNIVSLV